jgi:hypothetical protein
MTKKIFSLILIACFAVLGTRAYSQTVAMDFNQSDCAGTQHNLFDKLDNGKVVVITYVMLGCSPCIIGTAGIKSLLPAFEASHPGRVELLSFGYTDSYTCAQMTSWKNANSFSHPVFAGGEAQTNYYGGMGMPTVVVLGGPDHTVLYKSLGYETSHKPLISAAITAGLALWSGMEESLAEKGIHVYPSLFSDQLSLRFDQPIAADIQVFDVLGNIVFSQKNVETHQYTINTAAWSQGTYMLYLVSGDKALGSMKVVKY